LRTAVTSSIALNLSMQCSFSMFNLWLYCEIYRSVLRAVSTICTRLDSPQLPFIKLLLLYNSRRGQPGCETLLQTHLSLTDIE
jgi:hypothetical protein